jgi:DNA-binding PadR family transcriptional regulator
MAPRKIDLPEEVLKLIPLTPAVFFTLFALASGEKHGYAIMQETRETAAGRFRMGPATLYTTIDRLLKLDLLEEVAGSDDRRRYYRLTKTGREVLRQELSRMREVLRLAEARAL